MRIKKIPQIPLELQQDKAYELSQQRLLEGKESNSDDDWNDAREYLIKHPNKVLAWKLKRLRRSIKAFLDICWQVLVFPFWLLWKLPELFAQSDTKTFALDVVKTAITALGLIATFIAGIGLFVNYWSSEKNIQLTQKNIQLTQERIVTERFAKAIEQLGISNDVVVLGGIYSLERIAKDSPKDQSTIMEILSAFVRKNSPVRKNNLTLSIAELPNQLNQKESKELLKNNQVAITIQATLTVIGRRNQLDSKIYNDFIDLTGANLSGADLRGANLSNANLSEANLSGADLFRANLSEAKLFKANLSKASVIGAILSRAFLSKANLRGADLSKTNLNGAYLWYSDMSGTVLSEANLTGANLYNANLNGANLIEANLYKAKFFKAKNFTNKQIKTACDWNKAIYDKEKNIYKLEQDRDYEPKKTINCIQWKSFNRSI